MTSDDTVSDWVRRRLKYLIGLACLILYVQTAAGGEMRSALPEAQTQGPDAAILDAVSKELGLRTQVYYASFKRRLIMMRNGDIDFMCGLLKEPEREGYIHFVRPPYKSRSDTVFFMLKKNPSRLAAYGDLRHMAIGVTRGTKYFPGFDRDESLRKIIEPHAVSNFRKLLVNRLDVVVVNEAMGLDLVNQLNASDRLVMAPFRFSRKKHVYFGISKKSWMMQDLDRVESVLGQMIESGRIRAITTEYYRHRNLPVPAM